MIQTIFCGDAFIDVELPDTVDVLGVEDGGTGLEDPLGALRAAIAEPYDSPPLAELAGHAATVVVAFSDPCIPTPLVLSEDPRALALPEIMRILEEAGVASQQVRLICATGTHRKFTRGELAQTLGKDFVSRFPPQRLYCHDAYDDLVYVGETVSGLEVEVDRAVAEADLVIYVNVSQITLNGGWSSMVIGLGSFRSIRHHHCPSVIFDERSMIEPESKMQRAVAEQGRFLESAMGKKFFQIESTLTSGLPYEPSGFFAGQVDAAHKAAQDFLATSQNFPVEHDYDVVVVGVPNFCPYAVFSRINPVLVHTVALGYAFHFYRGRPLVRKGGAVVVANPLDEDFHEIHHPSYREFYSNALSYSRDPHELWDLFAEEYAYRPEFVHAYKHGHAFHGAHPVMAYTWGAHASAHAHILSANGNPKVAARLGYEPAGTVEEAVAAARKQFGDRVALVTSPPIFAADLRGVRA